MGGGFGCEGDVPEKNVKTVVLVGRAGNGKSATGNTILGRKSFVSKTSSSGVTTTAELNTSDRDGYTVNVIDTPGLCDFQVEDDDIAKEIAKCIALSKDGIHAILVVCSVRTRFTVDEERALRGLQILFGTKLSDYMIVLFTGGDDLEDEEKTLDEFLSCECPQPLKYILDLCKNRYMVFDNKTKDEGKREEQVGKLFEVIDGIIASNGGKPYTDDLFVKLQEAMKPSEVQETDKFEDFMLKSHEEQFKKTIQMLTDKLQETTIVFGQQLEEEQAARRNVEERAESATKDLENEVRNLKEDLKDTQNDLSEVRAQKNCTIL